MTAVGSIHCCTAVPFEEYPILIRAAAAGIILLKTPRKQFGGCLRAAVFEIALKAVDVGGVAASLLMVYRSAIAKKSKHRQPCRTPPQEPDQREHKPRRADNYPKPFIRKSRHGLGYLIPRANAVHVPSSRSSSPRPGSLPDRRKQENTTDPAWRRRPACFTTWLYAPVIVGNFLANGTFFRTCRENGNKRQMASDSHP
jgi:hypothetical protein